MTYVTPDTGSPIRCVRVENLTTGFKYSYSFNIGEKLNDYRSVWLRVRRRFAGEKSIVMAKSKINWSIVRIIHTVIYLQLDVNINICQATRAE